MNTLEALLTRRSIRKYETAMVEEALLDQVLQAGTYAPTGKGQQSAQIVAVSNTAIIEQLCHMNKEAGGTGDDPYYGAPVIVLVFAQKENSNHVQDASLVLGNMMNAAHALGLGSCWINRERQMFETEEGKEMMKAWGVAEDMEGVGALSLGYPKEAPIAKQRKQDYIIKVK